MKTILNEYITKPQFAEMFAVSLRTVDRWAAMPDGLPHVQLGRRKLFRLDACKEWLKQRERQPNPRRAA